MNGKISRGEVQTKGIGKKPERKEVKKMKSIDVRVAIEELEEEGKINQFEELKAEDLHEIFERAKAISEED